MLPLGLVDENLTITALTEPYDRANGIHLEHDYVGKAVENRKRIAFAETAVIPVWDNGFSVGNRRRCIRSRTAVI